MNNYLDFKNNIDYTKLKEPAKIIKDGGIVVFPTETVYGIGVNGLNKNALKKLYEVKQRPLNKPISLLVNSIEMINQLTKNITKLEYALMKEFFPGPLTIILQKKDIVPAIQEKQQTQTQLRYFHSLRMFDRLFRERVPDLLPEPVLQWKHIPPKETRC